MLLKRVFRDVVKRKIVIELIHSGVMLGKSGLDSEKEETVFAC